MKIYAWKKYRKQMCLTVRTNKKISRINVQNSVDNFKKKIEYMQINIEISTRMVLEVIHSELWKKLYTILTVDVDKQWNPCNHGL